jgi:DNA-binding beta-propeller fold protein YncE
MENLSPTRPMARISLVALASLGAAMPLAPALGQPAADLPVFEVEPGWPTVPAEWVLGEVSSIAVAADDHVWVLHRPRSIPEADRARAAPPVLEFDQDGKLLRSWGGEGVGYDWPQREHGISVDADGFVWITGNGGWPRPTAGVPNDDFILKFTMDGRFVMQIGKAGASTGNGDTANVHQPADQFVHEAANELYVADGYGNRRVIVFDATTGAFKRMWGTNGSNPADDSVERPYGLVHAVKVSNDGIVYVADRGNQRMQWFTTAGEFLGEYVVAGEAPPTPAGFSFSVDPEQKYLYVVESANARVLIFERASMTLLGQFGMRSAEPGGMDIAHHIAVDSRGNLYTAEIVNNRRAQRFLLQ